MDRQLRRHRSTIYYILRHHRDEDDAIPDRFRFHPRRPRLFRFPRQAPPDPPTPMENLLTLQRICQSYQQADRSARLPTVPWRDLIVRLIVENLPAWNQMDPEGNVARDQNATE